MTPRLSLVVRPLARADIREAARWYDGRSPGLGDRFLASVDAALRAAREGPERSRQVYREVRRVPVPDFPYALYVVLRGERLHVLACTHGRRHPSRWQGRARGL